MHLTKKEKFENMKKFVHQREPLYQSVELNGIDYALNNETYEEPYIEEITKDLKEAITMCHNEASKITFGSIELDVSETIVARLYGGLNGWGDWADYLSSLVSLINVLRTKFYIDAWIIEIKNDCLDDVFSVDLGIRYGIEDKD